ncbi:hypothetical protein J7T55_004349 [Diaporthe amygdali]|uniref:uncharacterized protein n=1 Tax=Phomopsis amygdali TaxID=1214568 RepID=UPI0022FEA247|nr:uncharacterized protein J7T55_004349 [Diaporthe amygdali]KAJ0109799.1 hypothetical protein J7T55_004349 [Diaporthe amygdali]
MHLAIRTASRVRGACNCRVFTAAPSTGVRHASNVSREEFTKEVIGTVIGPKKEKADTKKSLRRHPDAQAGSKVKVRRVQAPPHVRPEKKKKRKVPNRNYDLFIRKHFSRTEIDGKPGRVSAQMWPERPLAVFSRRRALNLLNLPAATTAKDIILSLENAAHEHKISQRSDRAADIKIKPRSDSSEAVDATVDFLHPDGAQAFHDLAVKGQLKVRGVVPEVSLDDARDPSEVPRPSGERAIGEVPDQDRAEFYSSPELRKIARRTTLIYN